MHTVHALTAHSWKFLFLIKIGRRAIRIWWWATIHPRIVNTIISYNEGRACSTTQYMAMAEIEFRIFSQDFDSV